MNIAGSILANGKYLFNVFTLSPDIWYALHVILLKKKIFLAFYQLFGTHGLSFACPNITYCVLFFLDTNWWPKNIYVFELVPLILNLINICLSIVNIRNVTTYIKPDVSIQRLKTIITTTSFISSEFII